MMFRKAIKDKPDKINLIKAGWVKLKVFIDKFQRSGHSLLLLSLSLPRHMTGFTSAFDARQCDRTPPTVTLYGAPQVGGISQYNSYERYFCNTYFLTYLNWHFPSSRTLCTWMLCNVNRYMSKNKSVWKCCCKAVLLLNEIKIKIC